MITIVGPDEEPRNRGAGFQLGITIGASMLDWKPRTGKLFIAQYRGLPAVAGRYRGGRRCTGDYLRRALQCNPG